MIGYLLTIQPLKTFAQSFWYKIFLQNHLFHFYISYVCNGCLVTVSIYCGKFHVYFCIKKNLMHLCPIYHTHKASGDENRTLLPRTSQWELVIYSKKAGKNHIPIPIGSLIITCLYSSEAELLNIFIMNEYRYVEFEFQLRSTFWF